MVFNSLTFVVFFVLVLVLHRMPLPWTAKKINLLVASYLFYAAWNPPFVILLWISTVVDWYIARGIWNARERLSDLDNTTIVNQRSYTTPVGTGANQGRHILTWLDEDFDGIVATDGSETVAFTTTTFASGNRHRWLDEDDSTIAASLAGAPWANITFANW